ncbi:MAG: gamma-glutamyltransferase [Roseobacter sp.]
MRNFHFPGRSPVFATNGMVATSHPLAAQVGVDILKKGGNAMDAAISSAVLLGLCEPQMTGIGGDCFVLWSEAGSDDVSAMNGSGRAARALDASLLRDSGLNSVPLGSPHAVTLPGAVDAFCHLAEAHGKLGLPDLLAPAIHYAEEGIPVAPRVASDWAQDGEVLQGSARSAYLMAGETPKPGDVFRAPGQAEVLRRIAKSGRDAFYTGEIAEDMIEALTSRGGLHTAEDFASVAATPTTPISSEYKGLEVVEHPPNTHGAIALLMLNMLSEFDLGAMDPLGAERAHIEAEVAKLAYDARNRMLGDSDHTARLAHLMSGETAKALASLVDPQRAMPSATTISEAVHKDTVYVTVVDKDGMSVSLIYSLFHGFGSGIASEKFGILLQNRGAGFTLEAGHPNELKGGKRPMHTIIPGMVRKSGKVIMPFGVMGGAYQPNGHARFVTNMVDFGMGPQSAIDAPRCFPDKNMLRVEDSYSDTVRQELSDLGHEVTRPPTAIGGAQAILRHENGVLEGASDPRKDGCALGY